MSPIVVDPVYGPKPSLTLLGGSPSSLATPSVPFLPTGRSLTMGGGGQLRSLSFAAIYRSQPWVATTIRRMAEHIARLPLQTFRFGDAAGDVRKRDREHGVAQLLSRPRPRQRGFHLRWDIALGLYVEGNYVAWKRRPRAGAPPFELWSLDWRLLIPILDGTRVLGWEWRGSGIPGLETGDVVLIEDTLHLAFGAPGGGELGVSPLEQLGVTIRSEDSLQRYAEASMRNGIRPGMAAILDPKVKADQLVRDGVRDELIDAHGGVDQTFRPAILGGGVVDLKPLGSQTAVDAELIAQRKVNREEVAAVIGIPAPVAGILEQAKYSSLSEFHRMLYVTALGGPLSFIGESIQAQLVDDEPAWESSGRFVEFSLDEVLKGDTKSRWETYKIALECGGLTLNDVRRRENLEPYPDPKADEPLVSWNNVRPLSALGAEGDTGNPPPAGAAASILETVAEHAARAISEEAAAEHLELDVDGFVAELAGALEGAGLNGQSEALARTFAEALERDLGHAGPDDVDDLFTRYAIGAR